MEPGAVLLLFAARMQLSRTLLYAPSAKFVSDVLGEGALEHKPTEDAATGICGIGGNYTI